MRPIEPGAFRSLLVTCKTEVIPMRFKLSTIFCLITVLFLVFTLPSPAQSDTIEVRVSSGNDDAEEKVSNGDMNRGSADLELIYDNSRGNQIVGIRFQNVQLPQGVTVSSAYIEFSADETDSTSTNLTIYGEDIDDAPQFQSGGSNRYNISNRTKTSASVSWSPEAWTTVHQAHQTTDIASIVQEIVDRAGWSAGNAMAFIIDGSGKRVAESYNGDNERAPLLHLEFDAPLTYTIMASAGNGGIISPSGPVTVNEAASQAFTITPDPGNSVADVLVDGASVGAVASYTFTNVTSDHTIYATFTLPPGTCTDIADIPLATLVRGAPPNIMFVLDDSGSMDWEFLTDESDGVFLGERYVFDNPGDNLYDDNYILSGTDRTRWKSQWSGYNEIYYDPTTDYDPWPTLDDADPVTPRSHPMHATPTFNLDGTYDSIETGVTIIDDEDTEYFSKTGAWDEATFSEAYNDHYYYTSLSDQDITATWASQLVAGDYEVYARWRALDNRCQAVPYTITHSGGSTTVYMDQRQNGGLWNLLGTFHLDRGAGTGDVTITYHVTDNEQYRVCADAVKFVPTGTPTIDVKRAHYYVWSTEENKPYLVVLDGDIHYYAVNDYDSDDIVDPGELWPTSNPPSDVQSGRTYTGERQNFANWYSFYRRRELTAAFSVAKVIANMQGVQIGIRTINGNLIQPVLKVKVEGDDESPALLSALYNLTLQAQGTPLRRGLNYVGQYFHQQDGVNPSGLGESPYASAEQGGGCQQAFAIVMTDGYWNGSSPGFANEDGDDDTDFDGPPYGDSYSDTLADVAMCYYENDLSTLDNLVPTHPSDDATHQHMVTFAVSFGVFGTLNPDDYDFENGPYPTWPNPTSGDQQKIDDLWHAAVNGRGTFLSASRPDELVSSLLSIMQNIESRIASASSVSVNGDELYEKLGEDILMFQASYFSDGWTGDVKAYGIDTTTGQVITTSYRWSAADELEILDWNTERIIATYDGSAGIPFRYDNLTSDQKTLLDTNETTARNILDFLRGDTSNEEQNGGPFRDRFWRLGDLVHSSPVYENGILYVGGNDGMLHAFDADNGKELFAYVPNLVFENLAQLSDPNYSHQYYVDLTPTVEEVTISGQTKTLLVGGLEGGGKGYFALDVSDASSIGSESDLASKARWEFSGDDDLGYSYSKAIIVESNVSGLGPIVIFGNGYNSINDHAVLFILDAWNGTELTRIDTDVGSCNGLSTPVAIDINYDDKVDYVYAGDLKGNLWKFDLTDDTSYLNWDVAYYDGAIPKPLFQATGPGGAAQLITTKPDVMYHCEKDGLMVVVATGRYLGETDPSDTTTQTIYGIWDYGDSFYDRTQGGWTTDDDSEYLGTFNRGSTPQLSNQPDTVTLLQQTEEAWIQVGGNYLRVITDNEPVWATIDDDQNQLPDPSDTAANHAGWYFDLPISGERVVSDLLIRESKAVVVSFYPETAPCGSGGYSIVHEMDACSGARLFAPQFDINEDGVINEEDRINIGTVEIPIWVSPSGVQKKGRLQPPAILRTGNTEVKYFSSSSGSIETVREQAVKLGIASWTELHQ
jgi:type IV pilus assembly protein PilY1